MFQDIQAIQDNINTYHEQEREILIAQAKLQHQHLTVLCEQIQTLFKSFAPYQQMNLKFHVSTKGSSFTNLTAWNMEFINSSRFKYKHDVIGTYILKNLKEYGEVSAETKKSIKEFQEKIKMIAKAIEKIHPISSMEKNNPISGYTLFEISNDNIRLQVFALQNGYKIAEFY